MQTEAEYIIKNCIITTQHIILDATLQIVFSLRIIIVHLTFNMTQKVKKKSHYDY